MGEAVARIVRLHRIGGPEVLQIDEVPLGAPRPDDVRIKVRAIGLNRVEAMYRSGEFGVPALPAKIGYEAAGVIDAVGTNVRDFKVGDRVATLPGLSMDEYGTYADTIFYPANMLLRIPDNLTLHTAAAAWMQYLTAYALIAIARIKQSSTVLITAASSSVGLAAIQIVNAAGGESIAVTRGRDKEAALRRHGARHVVVTDREDVVEAVMKLTQGRGADVAFDAVAGDMMTKLAATAAQRGMIIVYGALGGAVVPMPAQLFMLKSLTVRGFAMNDLISVAADRQQAVDFVYQGLQSGKLCPVIDRTFAFENIVDAHRYLESNQQVGKIVVSISE